jgi:hypothetical protein
VGPKSNTRAFSVAGRAQPARRRLGAVEQGMREAHSGAAGRFSSRRTPRPVRCRSRARVVEPRSALEELPRSLLIACYVSKSTSQVYLSFGTLASLTATTASLPKRSTTYLGKSLATFVRRSRFRCLTLSDEVGYHRRWNKSARCDGSPRIIILPRTCGRCLVALTWIATKALLFLLHGFQLLET